MKILLLDDGPDVLATFEKPLRLVADEVECILHTKQSVPEIVREILAHKPFVVLVDEYLAGEVRGHDVVRLLKKREPGLRVIGFSSSPGSRESFLEAGADGFVEKDSSDPERTVVALQALLRP